MDDSPGTSLSRDGAGNSLLPGSRRGLLIKRGRQDSTAWLSDTHYQHGIDLYTVGHFSQAADAFRLAAEKGHAESQYILSTMLDAGEGAPLAPDEAERWERLAAEQEHAYAQANASFRFYAIGNFDEAFAWCRRAANNGLAWAQYNLGLMYRKGEGTDPDDKLAAHLFLQAAEQRFAEAQTKLAGLYYLGHGVPQSNALAATWYRRAAEQGDAEGQFQLGHLYAVGQGVDLDYLQSRLWIQRAAQQGHAGAFRELKRREYRDA